MTLVAKPARFAGTGSQSGRWSNQGGSELNLPPSKDGNHGKQIRAAGRKPSLSAWKYCAAGYEFMACFTHQPSGSGSTMSRVSRKPNPSVNLTRNSVPRWPSEARYAHNAPLVHRVTLPRAGYLKR
jgi:hypothetical protein